MESVQKTQLGLASMPMYCLAKFNAVRQRKNVHSLDTVVDSTLGDESQARSILHSGTFLCDR